MTSERRAPRAAILAASLLAALFAASVALGCAGASPSGDTSDVFAALPEGMAGESHSYEVVDITSGERVLLGTGTLSASQDGELLALRQEYIGENGATDTSTVWVDASTFEPARGEREIAPPDVPVETFEWEYLDDGDETRMTSTHRRGDGDPSERSLRLRDHAYDNESSLWLWRSIALAEEYEAFYVSVNPIERNQQTVHLRVPQIEMVTVPAGEFEAYRLLFRSGRAVRTAWIEVAEPHRVLRWDNGETVLELVAP